jgi:PPP family 3-phenylpropionic acid transporter
MGGTNVANNTYFSFLYTEGGGTVAGVGVAMLLMVGSEVPFMALCEKITARFTMERVVLAAMAISCVRFLLYGMGLPWWMLIVLSFSQGMVNGIILVEFVRYAAKLAQDGYESLAISTYYVIGSNLSTICCQLIGGILLDKIGAAGVYSFFGLFNLCGVILYLAFKLQRSEE